MKTVYIFRGAPATGKGTVVPEFCELLPKPVALIPQDVLRWGLHLVGRNVADIEDSEHALANRNTQLVYEQYLKDGRYTIVLEGLFTWDDEASSQGSAKKLADLAKQYGFRVKSIILQADKKELLQRNAKRPYGVPLGEFEALYNNIYKTIGAPELTIDSTGKTPEETIELLKSIV